MRFRALQTTALAGVVLLSACASHASTPIPGGSDAFQLALASSAGGGTNGGKVYVIGDGSAQTGFLMTLSYGFDKQLYYATTPSYNNGWSTSGEIGKFSPSTHAQTYETVPYGPG